jgi:hypothetical protein
LCLFCDGIYSPEDSNNSDKPKTEDIINPENKIYNNEKHHKFLWNLGFYNTEPFDIKIYEFIVNGFFDSDFDKIANEYNKKFEIGTKQYKYRQSWNSLFHGSLDDNGDEVVNLIYDNFINGIDVMNSTDLQSIYQLLNDYGDSRCNKIFEIYFGEHKNNKEKFECLFINNPKVNEFLKKSLNEIKKYNLSSIDEAVENFLNYKNDRDYRGFLSEVSEEDFYQFFKKSTKSNLDKVTVSKNFKNADLAIKKIGKECKINELRIKYISGKE